PIFTRCRRRIRVSSESLRTFVGLPLRLDANVGSQERLGGHACYRILLLPDELPASAGPHLLRGAAASGCPWRAARIALRPTAGDGADSVPCGCELRGCAYRRRRAARRHNRQSCAAGIHHRGGAAAAPLLPGGG